MCEIDPARQKYLCSRFGKPGFPLFTDMKELPSGMAKDYNRGGQVSPVPDKAGQFFFL